jgi:hypothetical protein
MTIALTHSSVPLYFGIPVFFFRGLFVKVVNHQSPLPRTLPVDTRRFSTGRCDAMRVPPPALLPTTTDRPLTQWSVVVLRTAFTET